ncbi:MAG: FAD-binding domain-containing protein, partial [Proteobacteria bacterium]|nr:FAD-binding domain-containing protein [Burkholderiales bacterium]
TPEQCGLGASTKADAQRGGESIARSTLASFLEVRGVDFQKAMSSPCTAFDSCSRLSPYLAWGAISMRCVAQAAAARSREVRALNDAKSAVDPRWSASLRAFQGRLRWHCHFMQKLEDEPRIEFENFSRVYDDLRDAADVAHGVGATRMAAWQHGETGYPMVDACMRALHRCGWINFRMRAMLVSFASYHLWLHWRPTSVFLAQHFLDFEPGIHFSQFQMQSGTTGINTVRIYSPAKQVLDHDPQGEFIRRHVPALERVPARWLAEPHLMPASIQREASCVIGRDYPAPIVEHALAYREARERIGALRRRPEARNEADAVQAKHGSRRSGLPQSAGPGGRARAPRVAGTSRSDRSKAAPVSDRSGQASLWDEGADADSTREGNA